MNRFTLGECFIKVKSNGIATANTTELVWNVNKIKIIIVVGRGTQVRTMVIWESFGTGSTHLDLVQILSARLHTLRDGLGPSSLSTMDA